MVSERRADDDDAGTDSGRRRELGTGRGIVVCYCLELTIGGEM